MSLTATGLPSPSIRIIEWADVSYIPTECTPSVRTVLDIWTILRDWAMKLFLYLVLSSIKA